MLTDPPASDEIEVSVFGPGKGECVLLHLGDRRWIIVDSCVDQIEKKIPSLVYLRRLGYDLSRDVVLVVGTHAHDDHIAGISQVFDECVSANFVCSSALTADEFVVLTETDHEYPLLDRGRSYSEYRRIHEIAERRGKLKVGLRPLMRALQMRELLALNMDDPVKACRIISLSPSDYAVTRSLRKFSRSQLKVGERRRVGLVDPNELSVVLWVEVAGKTILLGADLLIGPRGCGWTAILEAFSPKQKADVFKVPHHGAPNAHHPDVWTQLLDKEPVAMLAPYRGGPRPRPDSEDRLRICALTSHAFAAAPTITQQPSRATREAMAAVASIGENVREPWGKTGQVRARSRIGHSGWKINLAPPATSLAK